eukprot:g6307.t1
MALKKRAKRLLGYQGRDLKDLCLGRFKMMKIVLCCSLLAVFGAPDPELQRFLDFAAKYDKTYPSQVEFNKRFAIFKHTLSTIDVRNAAGTLGVHNVTRWADLEFSEFAAQHLGGRSGHSTRNTGGASKWWPTFEGKPAAINWAKKGATTPIKNQGQLLELSPQQVTSCDPISGGCDGGWTYWAYDYVKSAGGIEAAASYPYVSGTTEKTGNCTAQRKLEIVEISGYHNVSEGASTEPNMAAAIQEGPLSVCLDATTFGTYQSGIVGKGCGTDVNHCVQAVGIGTNAAGETYWIGKFALCM